MIIGFLKNVVTPIAFGSGAAFLLVKFLGKKLFDQVLKKEILKYKSELEEKTSFLKTKLSIYAEEQNIVNQRVDNQKASAIHAVYSDICQMISPITKIVAGSPHVTNDQNVHVDFYFQNSELAHDVSKTLAETIQHGAIYFSAEIYEEIGDLYSTMTNANAHFLRIFRRVPPQYLTTDEQLGNIEEGRKKLGEIFETEIQPLKAQLVQNFRQILQTEKQ